MPVRPRTRLKDIAEKTGYSINTVSVALRGGARVPAATRALIVAAARELDYLPNAFARSLAKRRSGTIGIVVNNFLNPTLTACAEHVSRLLEDRGFHAVIAATHNDVERERRALESLREYQADGILIYPVRHREIDHIAALRAAGFPVVMLSGVPDAAVDLVGVDDHAGAFKLTRHLLDLGHRRIAFVDVGQLQGNSLKSGGYAAAHAAAGVPLDPRLLHCPAALRPVDCGYQATARVMALDDRPTAIMASTDMIAIGVLGWLDEHGLAVPADVAVAGFDDIELSATSGVRLTTVGYSVSRVGERAVARLTALLDAPAALPAAAVEMIEPDLVVRASTVGPGAGRRRRRSAPAAQPGGARPD